MRRWKQAILASAIAVGSLAGTASLTFADSGSVVARHLSVQPGQTSITLTVPNLNGQLQPYPTQDFVFYASGYAPMTEKGALVPGTYEYTVPLPNYGKTVVVQEVSTAYTYQGVTYTTSAGPLIDTLPEAPFAAALPLAMLGVWYFVRRRNSLAH